MTEKEILTKAIEKALKQGMLQGTIDKGTFYQEYVIVKGRKGQKLRPICFVPEDCYGLIFSLDFADAFWPGTTTEIDLCTIPVNMTLRDVIEKFQKIGVTPLMKLGISISEEKLSKFHLQQMVIMEKPIRYLEQFIN